MRDIKIGDYWLLADLGAALTAFELGLPDVKTIQTELPAGDGILDFTDFFGGPKYSNREGRIGLVYAPVLLPRNVEVQMDTLLAMHGTRQQIRTNWTRSGYHLDARLHVEASADLTRYGTMEILLDCRPFWIADAPGTKTITTTAGTETHVFTGLPTGFRPAVATVSNDAEITLTWGDYSLTVSAGTRRVPDLVITDGLELTIAGVIGTTVSISWQTEVI